MQYSVLPILHFLSMESNLVGSEKEDFKLLIKWKGTFMLIKWIVATYQTIFKIFINKHQCIVQACDKDEGSNSLFERLYFED